MPFAATLDGNGSSTPFGSLLLAVFNSILEVVLICSAGYILASHGILDKKTQKQLNRLNVSLFTPALLFSKVALYLTPEKLKQLYVIPIWFLVVTIVSMSVGSLLGWIFGLKSSQRSFVMAAAMFMNSNALPIALMQSLVVAVPDLKWGADDDKNVMLGRALTYLTMYSTMGMILRYSYGIRLLARADTVHTQGIVDEQTPLLADLERNRHRTLSTHPSASTFVSHEGENGFLVSSPKSFRAVDSSPDLTTQSAVPRPGPVRRGTTKFYNSFPNSPNDSCEYLGCSTNSSSASSSSSEDEEEDGIPPLSLNNQRGQDNHEGHERHRRHRHSLTHRILRYVRKSWLSFYDFMTVPLWAALLSLIVACIQPLQHALTYHLIPVNGAINTAGKCSVPLTLVVLGAYFYPEPSTDEGPKLTWRQKLKAFFSRDSGSDTAPQVKETTKPGETKTVFLAVAARMLVTPIVVMPLVVLATKYDFHRVFEDPVFVVCNIILLASPPALTLAQITQAVSGDAFERLISRTIFWSYCVCTPPITILYVVIGLFLAKLE
ncbi:endoplasmic reticulum protein [Coprinopsis marcescibilis]|uniref:Endoplasmic reticulum protein n=1 Tax=Coprinopsis marcescibilis TaxID=230819 RepID=A0A5C3KFC7_COPMA|nr:endoplasmic reticulum protein [Coprinopsis marcescibilis]